MPFYNSDSIKANLDPDHLKNFIQKMERKLHDKESAAEYRDL